jgi:hypothetical protein
MHCPLLVSQDFHFKSHRFSDPRNSVSMKTFVRLFINHGNHDDSFVKVTIHICIWFLVMICCVILEMLNLINIGSAVAIRRNLVDPIHRTNMRPHGREVERSILRTEGNRFESRWVLIHGGL